MNYTRIFSLIAAFVLVAGFTFAQGPGRDYGYDRGYYGNDWRNQNWDGHGYDDYRYDHEFWRGR